MSKKPTKKERDRVYKLVERLSWMFSINNYDVNIDFAEENKGNANAEIYFDEKYLRAYFTIYPVFFEEDLKEQRKIILHELCHTITLPSKLMITDLHEGKHITTKQIEFENERATCKIENMLDRFLKGSLIYVKDSYKDYLK